MGQSERESKSEFSGHTSRTERKQNSDLAKRKRENGAEVDGAAPLGGDDTSDTRPSKKKRRNRNRNDRESLNTNDSHFIDATAKSTSAPKPPQHALSPSSTTPPIFPGLLNSYDISTLSIISSSKIEKRVTTILSTLSQYPLASPARPTVVMLHARADCVSKMITVVEIAKREIGANGGKWFQYNALHSVVKEQKKVQRGGKEAEAGDLDDNVDVEGGENEDGAEEEESFEKMMTPFERVIEGKVKVRTVPSMATYLSKVRIEGLRKRYGEQTNGLEVKETSGKQ